MHVERQDLDEMLGNLIENAAKYGQGRVFVTVAREAGFVEILVEDDGPRHPAKPSATRCSSAARGSTPASPAPASASPSSATSSRSTSGTISLEESEDLGGLVARLRLPAAAAGVSGCRRGACGDRRRSTWCVRGRRLVALLRFQLAVRIASRGCDAATRHVPRDQFLLAE